MKDSTIKANVD